MRALLVLALCACAAPDRVGVGANASQFDYFASAAGGTDSWPFTNDTGYGYGLNAWAEWDIGTPERMVRFEWPSSAPFYLGRQESGPTVIPIETGKVEVDTDAVDVALKAGDKVNQWSPTMQMGFWLACIAVVVVLGKKLLDKWFERQERKQS